MIYCTYSFKYYIIVVKDCSRIHVTDNFRCAKDKRSTHNGNSCNMCSPVRSNLPFDRSTFLTSHLAILDRLLSLDKWLLCVSVRQAICIFLCSDWNVKSIAVAADVTQAYDKAVYG
jgi:hypothetical protein